MKLPDFTKRTSAGPSAARWLAAGLLIVLFAMPTQAFAQTCGGGFDVFTDGTDLNGNTIPDYLFDNLAETVEWTLVPKSGTANDITVSQVEFALTCANNGDQVPCTGGNDEQTGNTLTPIQYTHIGAPGGTCGATLNNVTAGIVTFDLPEATLDTNGCTIIFDTELQDRGTDGTPDALTPALHFTGTCLEGVLNGSANGSAIIEILDPEIDVTKTGPDTAKVGDEIIYTIGFTALSDGELLGVCTGNDTVLGPLGVFVDGVNRDFLYTVKVTDPDPLPNTATITCDVTGSASDVSDFDNHSVTVIDPSIDVTKTGPDTAKVGDEITYTIGFTDTGTGTLGTCTGSDPLLGGDLGVFLAGVPRDFLYTVKVDVPRPLLNTATITCDVVGFDNTADGNDSHSVTVIDPSIDVTKTGPDTAKVGDEITYTIGFTNTGTGTLGTCTGSDTLLGDLGVFLAGVPRDFLRTALVTDPDPLPNTATITCDVVGFDNNASDSDSHSVDLIDPSVDLTKECRPDPVRPGEDINWAITIDNTGDIDLDCVVNDPIAGFFDEPVSVPAFGSEVLNASRTVEDSDAPVISNTATVVCPIPGFDNTVDDEDTADCEVVTGVARCRTPGFWGSRGGDDGDATYKHGENYTLLALALSGGFEICGSLVDNTDLGDPGSAIEAICISKGDPMAKYMRMATSAALNCNLGDCGYIEDLLVSCSSDCEAGDEDAMNACAAELGCFNEGGIYEEGMCVFAGTCYVDGDTANEPGDACSYDSDRDGDLPVLDCMNEGEFCVRDETCHDRDLCPDGGDYCWESLGPASSPKKCNKARKTTPYIFDITGWPVTP